MIDTNFAIFFGGTSLLIFVAVVLDTIQQINGHLSMHGFDGESRNNRRKSLKTT